MQFDDLCLSLRGTQERLRDQSAVNKDLEQRHKVMSEDLTRESGQVRAENAKKQDTICKLQGDNKRLDETLLQVVHAGKACESDLQALRKNHEWTRNDCANTIRRLEQENYNVAQQRADLDRN